ncbi:hypothetical protein [Kistimonas scapharcae]|uniref:hypothetical protein n=1 Tax=Kistimonas scapharcae TaxID=1036133 RepID=UPI0031E889DB
MFTARTITVSSDSRPTRDPLLGQRSEASERILSPAFILPAVDDVKRSSSRPSRQDSPPFFFSPETAFQSQGLLSEVLPLSPTPVFNQPLEMVSDMGACGECVSEGQREALPARESMQCSEETGETSVQAGSIQESSQVEMPAVINAEVSVDTPLASVEMEPGTTRPLDILAMAMAEIHSPVPGRGDRECVARSDMMRQCPTSAAATSSGVSPPKRRKKVTGQKSGKSGSSSYQCGRCHRGFRIVAHYTAHEMKCKEMGGGVKSTNVHKSPAASAMVLPPTALSAPQRETEPLSHWACHLCDKTFSLERSLKIHLDLHERYGARQIPEQSIAPGEKEETPPSDALHQPIRCNVCGETFGFEATLQYHMLCRHEPLLTREAYARWAESIRKVLSPPPALETNPMQTGTTETGGRIRTERISPQDTLDLASRWRQSRYRCSLCREECATESLLNNHIQLHFMTLCNPLPENLKVPIPRLKPSEMSATCEKGKRNKSVSSKSAPAKQGQKIRCAICAREFSTHYKLVMHGRAKHSGQKIQAATSVATSPLTTRVATATVTSIAASGTGRTATSSPRSGTSTQPPPVPTTDLPSAPMSFYDFEDIPSVEAGVIPINEPGTLLIPMSPGLSTPPPPLDGDET